ncbi:MAG: TonB-dependent receptor domain-containing protein [Comamonas sp.]
MAWPAIAQERRLSDIQVTASRTAMRVEESLADVTVITREQVQQVAPGRSLAEVLQRFAGIQLSSNGGRGHTQNVFLRGTSSSHALLLVDGVRYGSAIGAAPSLANIPLELIERIEIVKGPASALYGSEAVGGVIQVFTKQGKGLGKVMQAEASLTRGTHGHSAASAHLRGEQSGWNYQLGVGRLTEKGISATNVLAAPYHDPDRDALDQTSLNLGLGYAIDADWRVDALLTRADGTVFTDADPGTSTKPYTEMQTQVAHLKLTGQMTPVWRATMSMGHSLDQSHNLGSSWNSVLDTTQTEWKWDNSIQTPWGEVLAGVEHLDQSVDTSSDFAIKQRSIGAVFVGMTGAYHKHSWQANVRRDDNSQFGQFTSYSSSYGFELHEHFKLIAAQGKSMRAPSFGDLYGQWGGSSQGNPSLKPEYSHSRELAAQANWLDHRLKLVRFDNKIRNLISTSPTGMQNVAGETRLQGWTLEYGWHNRHWNVGASADHLKAREANGRIPDRRAKTQWSLQIDRDWHRWKLGGNVLHVGRRSDGSRTLAAFTSLDVFAQYQLHPDWSVMARVANVTDRNYQMAYGFNTLGRAAYVTLKWAPQ